MSAATKRTSSIARNYLPADALLNFYAFYGDSFKMECPKGSGQEMNLFEVAREIANRLICIFLRDPNGRTGWSDLVATLIELFRSLDAKTAAFVRDEATPKLPKRKVTK